MTSSGPRPQIKTFGCRLNIWESEVMSRHADDAGMDDVIVINTCAVTAEAEKQARQAIRKSKRDHPEKQIIVTGCAAQINPDEWSGMDEVDAIIGNHEKLDPVTWRRLAGANDGLPSIIGDIMSVEDVAPHLLEGFDGHTRAFLQIQQGCDHRCTFCIIPYGRGQSRSVPIQTIIDQVKKLADNGVGEVVLTGVDVTSWGSDLDGQPSLGMLLRRLLRSVPDLPRLRMSSIDPAEIDDEMMAAYAEDQRLMPHLHLSAQHGSDMMLKRMKRRHLRDDLLDRVAAIRAIRPDVVFGADLIAGFPTETDEDHAANLSLIDEAGLTWLHIFPYSPRAGTPAAKMPQHDGSLIKARAAALREAAAKAEQAFLKTMVGKDDDVLMETGGIGHTRQFAKARIIASSDDRPDHKIAVEAGRIYPVRVKTVSDTLVEVGAEVMGILDIFKGKKEKDAEPKVDADQTPELKEEDQPKIEEAAHEAEDAPIEEIPQAEPAPEPKPEPVEDVQPESEPEIQPEAAAPETPEAEETESLDAPKDEAPQETSPKKSWFGRLKDGLGKSASKITTSLAEAIGKPKLDASDLDDIEDALIMADLGVAAASRLTEGLKKRPFPDGVTQDSLAEALAEEVAEILTPVAIPLEINPDLKPHVILMVGVNGSGKTTTSGKLAEQWQSEGKKVMMAAADTFRAAAVEQLKVWGERTGTTVISGEQGSDAAAVAFQAYEQAITEKADVLIIDTAGRLQAKAELMDELAKICRVVGKKDEAAPHDRVIVLDGTVGQNASSQVSAFKETAGLTGMIVTKLDGSARGGVVVALAESFALPIHAVGVGEGKDDLRAFDAKDFGRALAGLGD